MIQSKSTDPVLPGATLGVLGSGQLGRMFAIAARRMGYRVHTFSPDNDTPTGQVADKEINASYDDLDAIRSFAKEVDVVTFEFENVPHPAAAAAAEFAPVRPGGDVLHITQHRLREKTFLRDHGFPVTPFIRIGSELELSRALSRQAADGLGGKTSHILKTAGWGYDGKGQVNIHCPSDGVNAWRGLDTTEAILESFVDFKKEISVVAARAADGSFAHWGPIENDHHHHILDTSFCPAAVSSDIANQAIAITRGILEQLNAVGVLCVELFVTRDEKLIVNEIAPRPHNSGHFTFDASVTSQFEQQVRSICNLPLGNTDLLRPAAMANLLGDLWFGSSVLTEPNWRAAMAKHPTVKLHLYGKLEPRPGRKMGHLTAMADTPAEALEQVQQFRAALLDS